MSSNGGTLHGPHHIGGHHACSHCGLMFESATSLSVHMHYQHEGSHRWGQSPPTSMPSSTTPTDSENNNTINLGKHHIKAGLTTLSPLHHLHQNTIAAADSSDAQPATPQPENFPAGHSPYVLPPAASADVHYPTYYDQYYHGMDYGAQQPAHNLGHQQEYKSVPSTRYHPYHVAPPANSTTSNGLSPRIVSSTSPTQNSLMQASSPMHIPPGQPTPSPSPKQCDKCGLVCETDGQLIEHAANAHPIIEGATIKSENLEHNYPPFPPQYIKDEPSSDILDLDSQKMVYPPQEGALPSMQHLHPLQSMQRHPMMWGHDHHGFLPPHPTSEIKSPYYHHQPMKPEYPPTPPIKNEYLHPQQMNKEFASPPVSMKQEYHIKSDYNNMQAQTAPDLAEGNQLTTSPSDFPSTTTPQENGAQFRSFEPATSSLPASKGAAWKSNEARRPKTYNCTACNKWFTSSGHLKRHYNTTLHKNAVKSSGQPDPATLPISAHHHPGRDPNYSTKRRHHQRNQQHQQQQQAQAQAQMQQSAPIHAAEPPRSPEYQPQFTLPSFGSASLPQGFQQYGAQLNLHQSLQVSPKNGLAGPSVQASQARGLQNPTTYNTNSNLTVNQLISTPTSSAPIIISSSSNSQDQYPLLINTNCHSYIITEAPSYLHTTGNSLMESISSDELIPLPSMYPHMQQHSAQTMSSYEIMSRYTGGAVQDLAPPFSPDIPEQYESYHEEKDQEMAHTSHSPAPSSPSITSTQQIITPAQNKSVANTAEHRCVQCDKVFNKSCYLTQHNKTFHSGDKPFKCQRCGKRFPCDQSHEEHFAKHQGDKPFKCEQCPKMFNHKTDLRRHMCLHSGSKPYSCQQCGKGFIRKDHMVKHMDTHTKKKLGMAAVISKRKEAAANGNPAKKMRLSSVSLSGTADSSDSLHYTLND